MTQVYYVGVDGQLHDAWGKPVALNQPDPEPSPVPEVVALQDAGPVDEYGKEPEIQESEAVVAYRKTLKKAAKNAIVVDPEA